MLYLNISSKFYASSDFITNHNKKHQEVTPTLFLLLFCIGLLIELNIIESTIYFVIIPADNTTTILSYLIFIAYHRLSQQLTLVPSYNCSNAILTLLQR